MPAITFYISPKEQKLLILVCTDACLEELSTPTGSGVEPLE